ncbi:ATP-binding cassette domain-containing protein [Cohnella suwonensis]|uniref:ATP-binding cassette domain-containing protein n=1 Tax=Cohnella suwonensis TaxID=696072 RepID=A0ABW0M063_9BACL
MTDSRSFNKQVLEGTYKDYAITALIGLLLTALTSYQLDVTKNMTDELVALASPRTALLLLAELFALLICAALLRLYQQYRQNGIQLRVQGNLDRILAFSIEPVTISRTETPGFKNDLNVVRFSFQSLAGLYLTFMQITVAVVSIGTYMILIFKHVWYLPFVILLLNAPKWHQERRTARDRFVFAVRTSEVAREKTLLQELLFNPATFSEQLVFASKLFIMRKWRRAYAENMKQELRFNRLETIRKMGYSCIAVIAQIAVQFLLIVGVIQHSITLGAYISVIAATGVLEASLLSLASYAGQLHHYKLTKKKVIGFLNEYLSEQSKKDEPMLFQQRLRTIELRNLIFAYPGRDWPTIRQVSLQIRLGDSIVLVGDNGCGKSTLAKLIAGLHEVDAGMIFYNGADTNRLERRQIYKKVSIVTQDYINYPFSIYECVTMSADPDDARYEAIRKRYPYLFPEGMDKHSIVGLDRTGATQLSGGQWQKLAIARALYKDSPVLILDEATSALDPETEKRFFHDLMTERSTKALIAITHRMNVCPLFSKSVVLQEGRIVEQGHHDELLQLNGKYSRMFEAYTMEGVRSKYGSVPTVV